MAADGVPAAPRGRLTARSRKLWTLVVDEYELSPAELELLRGALEALDRADDAAAIIAKDGVIVKDRYDVAKSHPAVDVEQRYRTLYARSLAQLGVKAVVESDVRRSGKTGPKASVTPLRSA